MFFDKFPPTLYRAPDGSDILVTDWIRAVRIPQSILDEDAFYEYYLLKDNETPEIVSHKLYKSAAYHWLVMAVNQKYDVWNDYPKDDSTIRKMAAEKYANIDGIHHYEDANGSIVDSFTIPNIPITNIEYEIQQNESKRIIKVVKFLYLSNFLNTYTQLISEDKV
jgi:hypothetical protein